MFVGNAFTQTCPRKCGRVARPTGCVRSSLVERYILVPSETEHVEPREDTPGSLPFAVSPRMSNDHC